MFVNLRLKLTENGEVQAQTPFFKAASGLGLHFFLWRSNATAVVKGLGKMEYNNPSRRRP